MRKMKRKTRKKRRRRKRRKRRRRAEEELDPSAKIPGPADKENENECKSKYRFSEIFCAEIGLKKEGKSDDSHGKGEGCLSLSTLQYYLNLDISPVFEIK